MNVVLQLDISNAAHTISAEQEDELIAYIADLFGADFDDIEYDLDVED
ncbi:MAG: hypothetical protein IJT54_05990 [Candidatus Methanomethylophilaceae archaeon]|nr:hypothetical protein [Candidatus Methanomethylophilaceae archaeon]